MSFKDKINLDISSLEQAALIQPSLYYENGEDWAKAVLERDRIKERLAAKKAEVDEKVRNNPSKYGANSSTKITETWIANKIAQNKEVMKLSEELISSQYDVNIMAVAKETLDHRLKALSILTELYKGSYFAASAKTTDFYKKAIEAEEEKQRLEIEKSPRIQKLIKRRKADG